MKKYLFIVLLVGVGISNAQTLYTGIGYSKNAYNENDILDLYDMSSFNGYQFGVEHSIKNITFGIGINLIGNKAKLKDTQIEVAESYRYLSIHLTYSYPIMNKYKPYIGLMIGDNVFADATIKGYGYSDEYNIEIKHHNSLMVGMDYMFTPKVGLRISYSRSLNDIGKDIMKTDNWKNHTLGFTVLLNRSDS